MDPERFARTLVRADATVRETIECIDAGAIEIALVVDDERGQLLVEHDTERTVVVVRADQHDRPMEVRV